MKKLFLGLGLCVIVLLAGCGKKTDEEVKVSTYGNEEGTVIVYHKSQGGVQNPDTIEAILKTDKSITIDDTSAEGLRTISLTQDQYDEILSAAFSSEFFNLKEEKIGYDVEGGKEERITIYYDGTSLSVGGANIQNATFRKVVNLLLK